MHTNIEVGQPGAERGAQRGAERGAVRAAVGNQFQLLGQRRFAALFWTQFLGAFNDNLFKSAITLVFVFSGLIAAEQTDIIVNLAAGLFILPFFLFSTLAGQLADKHEKSRLVRLIKLAEILVAGFAVVAVLLGSVPLMLAVLFLLGAQSTFFGPLKYSILPQQLRPQELVGGNAMIEMGTFVAILLGTVFGGIVATTEQVTLWLSVGVLGVAMAGYLCSRAIPSTAATDPSLVVGFNPIRETGRLLVIARKDRSVLLSILGISWFWLLGAGFLAQIPNLARVHLNGTASVVTLILSVFTIAIALGSLACEKLSGSRVEIGLVPVGAFVLSMAGIDLYFAIQSVDASVQRTWLEFFGAAGAWRVLLDLGLIGVSGGLFIVPLYALIQSRTAPEERARIIAFNNIVNAVFMVSVALLAALLLGAVAMAIPDFLLMLALLNIAVACFIFYQVPEFAMRFLVWALSHSMYRVTHENLEAIPDEGGALIVCNHVTYVDALLLAGAVKRPIRFIMLKSIYDLPVLNFVFRTCRTIPIVGRSVDEAAYERAFADIRDGLAAGDLLCIFPEGGLTKDGAIAPFRAGVERILAETPVPVVPMALRGLWQSFFSHYRGAFNLLKGPKRLWSRVTVAAMDAIAPAAANAALLERRVSQLRGDHA